jgi:hypothetical protein
MGLSATKLILDWGKIPNGGGGWWGVLVVVQIHLPHNLLQTSHNKTT